MPGRTDTFCSVERSRMTMLSCELIFGTIGSDETFEEWLIWPVLPTYPPAKDFCYVPYVRSTRWFMNYDTRIISRWVLCRLRCLFAKSLFIYFALLY
jgi:hypothetical protein